MTDKRVKVSSKFPEGYGDLAIQSSDDVVCYFPGPILTHTSTVFRDMFEMPKPGTEEGSSEPLVKITEPVKILEAFLAHLDPNTLTPSIHPGTIKGLLIMADKYQVTKIIRWFEQQATHSRANSETVIVDLPFVLSHPIICLSVAKQFNFQHIVRVAFRELSGCSAKAFQSYMLKLDPIMVFFLYQFRNLRIERYQAYVTRFTDLRGKGCGDCSGVRADWIRKIMLTIQDTPTWPKFKEAFDQGLKNPCEECKNHWSLAFVKRLPVWERKSREEESKLPDWPF
jgi:hypothetical protein